MSLCPFEAVGSIGLMTSIPQATYGQDRSFTTHVNRDIKPRLNVVETTITSRLRDFVSVNPPTFLSYKVGEDPREIVDSVYKVSQMWYNQRKDNRLVESGPIEWEEFKEAFLGNYFPHERRELKVEVFINLKHGNMSVEEYSLKFNILSRNKNYGQCLIGTESCVCCGKDGNKVWNCPTIAARGKEGKKVPPSVSCNDAPKKNHFYALRARGSNLDDEDDLCKL
ncbi:hypothetical protein EJD97_011140 [Solanum chilense]|uniref:Retrotransposon gag domain-containing protein n=1 Tax=Solanum chilense TaxID=4083 RepID=A0A6N2CC93_SOLCI|nr:hypothetical protein EJD97_011140 [Solanum chilense]